jgi:hypothetical protein
LHDSELVMDMEKLRRGEADPVELVADFSRDKDDCSVASTVDDEEVAVDPLSEKTFFKMETVEEPSLSRKCQGTKVDMNPLSGYEIVPELQVEFRAFVAGRDARLAKCSSAQSKQRMHDERASACRQLPQVVQLFDAVVDAFALFVSGPEGDEPRDKAERQLWHKRRAFGFKYCPTPGCSADKATGNLESGGVGYALMARLSHAFGKGFPQVALSPYGKEFKEWVASFRRAYGVAESFIGSRQVKQIDLFRAPAGHLRKWSDRIHKRHNADHYAWFERESRRRMEEKVRSCPRHVCVCVCVCV